MDKINCNLKMGRFKKAGLRNVDAFDISEHGIAKLQQKCKQENIRLRAFTADLISYQFEKKYDMVMSFGTLHFVKKEDWKALINRAKEYTKKFCNLSHIHLRMNIRVFLNTCMHQTK